MGIMALARDRNSGFGRMVRLLPVWVLLFGSMATQAADLGTYNVYCTYGAGQETVELYPRAGDTFTINVRGSYCDGRYLQGTPITNPGNGSYSGTRTFTFTSTPSSITQFLVAGWSNAGTRFYFRKPPSPSVTSVEPASGTTAGGTLITLRGTNFTQASSVTVGGTACSGLTVIDAETARCTTLAGPAGWASVRITTPGGTSWSNGYFNYVAPVPPAPQVSSVTPSSGSTDGGTSITITGTAFTGATGIGIGGVSCASFNVTSATTATCTTPPGNAGSASVDVTTGNGTNPANALFTFIQPPPAISAVSPDSGPPTGGTDITIMGSNFTGATGITIGGSPCASFNVTNAMTATCTTPSGNNGAVNVAVTTPSGTTAANSLFTFVTPPPPPSPPTVTSVSPTSGISFGGTNITITGTDLTGATSIKIGGNLCSNFAVTNATTATCITPSGVTGTPRSVEVTTAVGTNTANTLYTYTPPPTGSEVQLNFTSVMSANVVRNLAGDACDFDAPNRCFVSSSLATNDVSNPLKGLPDNGQFPANDDHPLVVLKPFNTSPAANNAWKATVLGTTNFPVTPSGQYSVLHVFATAGGASPLDPASMQVTLTYSDNTQSSPVSFEVPDWFGNVSGSGYYLRDGMDRWNGSYEPVNDAAVFGFPVQADPSKTLTSISINVTGIPSGGVFALFGATATTADSAALPPVVDSVWPTSLEQSGGTKITLSGHNFFPLNAAGLSVNVGGATCTNLQVAYSGSMTCTTPGNASVGPTSIVVSNSAGSTTFSSGISYVNTVPPAQPTNVAVANNLGQLDVTFTASSGATSYTATCSSASAGAESPLTASGSSSPLMVTGATLGASYTCSVIATNANGDSSAGAGSGAVTPSVPVPGAPSAVTASGGAGQALVSWTAAAGNDITGYTVTTVQDNSKTCTASAPRTSCTVTGLTNGTAYTFTVTAYNAGGTGPSSAASSPSITPLGAPGAPTGVTAAAGVNQAVVVWTPPTNTGGDPIAGYTVIGAPSGSCSVTGDNTCTVTDLTNGTPYTFTVIASNEVGSSVASAASNSVTPTENAAPAIISVTPTFGPASGGTSVRLIGANLQDTSSVLFGDTASTNLQVNQAGTQVTVSSPANSGGPVDLVLTTPLGTAINPLAFTYGAPPSAPGTPIAAPSRSEATVSWQQVFTGGTPDRYVVTASPGGQTCTVNFKGAAFPTAMCVVTGLTNGTAYTFTVEAINTLGSATSGASAPATPEVVTNGSCGLADGVTLTVSPSGMLCGAGSASAVTPGQGTFRWSCSGTGGGTTAQCSAPGALSSGPATATTTFESDTSSTGCKIQTARVVPPPAGGPGNGINLLYGGINFQMTGCTGNRAHVRITYSNLVEGLPFWKYVVNSVHNGWVQMPANQVTLTGNTAEFDIVDNGEWDNDPAVGSIADPGGPALDPNNLPATPGVPTNVTATAGNRSATVRWSAPSSGGQPVVYTVTANTGESCQAVYPQTSCTINGLTNGVPYTFTVVASNTGGNSAASATTTPITPAPPPPNPIPTLGEWTRLVMMLMMIAAVGWQTRRVRQRR
jgi:hypothetical protein